MIDIKKYRKELDEIHQNHTFSLSLRQIGECIAALEEAKEIIECVTKDYVELDESKEWLTKYFGGEE